MDRKLLQYLTYSKRTREYEKRLASVGISWFNRDYLTLGGGKYSTNVMTYDNNVSITVAVPDHLQRCLCLVISCITQCDIMIHAEFHHATAPKQAVALPDLL